MPNEQCYKLHLEGKAHRKQVRNTNADFMDRRTMAEEAYFRRFPDMVPSASASSTQNPPTLTTSVVGKVPDPIVKAVSSSDIPDTQTVTKSTVEASTKCKNLLQQFKRNPVEKIFIVDPVLPTPAVSNVVDKPIET